MLRKNRYSLIFDSALESYMCFTDSPRSRTNAREPRSEGEVSAAGAWIMS